MLALENHAMPILGVQIIGPRATGIVQHCLLVVQEKKGLNDLLATVSNYPTLHDLYKYAACDGLGNGAGHKIKKLMMQ